MFDIEGISAQSESRPEIEGLRPAEKDYIREALDTGESEFVTDRIDELSSRQPPLAVDANPEIAEIIAPFRDHIPNEYLEAPTDIEQVEQIHDVMCAFEELDYGTWKDLDAEGRLDLLQELEDKAAEIEHRPACNLSMKDIGDPATKKGYCNQNEYGENFLVINSKCLQDSSLSEYWESLDTVLHEGRHAYQNYNMDQREVNVNWKQTEAWRQNMADGYKTPEWDGYRAYRTQPIEADAHDFAAAIISRYKESQGYTA